MEHSYLERLNEQQREAVTYGDGPLLVVAGAGSGKTGMLAARTGHLIEQGVAPGRVLLLTFTRRAAAEMIGRVRAMISDRRVDDVWAGTFHAIGLRLLRTHGRALGLTAEFTVHDRADSEQLMGLIRSELGLGERARMFARKETLLAIYSRTINGQDKLRNVLEKHYPDCAEDIEEIVLVFEQFTRRKRTSNVLDFDDLLLYWKALCDHRDIGGTIADQFDHILVDEYQDTNVLQAEILYRMRRRNPNITVVGDDMQAIFAFRAANVRNILEFPERFPGTRIVRLEQNYRSTQPILAVANAVIAGAREGYRKRLFSERETDQLPILIPCQDGANEAKVVCTNVLEHHEQGIPLRRQAVLFRAGYHSAELEIELAHRKIPYRKFGGRRFVEAAHIKDVLAVLRFIENPCDELSWYRALQLLEGIGPKTARTLIDSLGVKQPATVDPDRPSTIVSPLHKLVHEPPKVPPAARQQLKELRAVVTFCCDPTILQQSPEPESRDSPHMPSVAQQVERVGRFYEPIARMKFDDWTMRLRDVEQLQAIAARYPARAKFLTDLALEPPTATSDLAAPSEGEDDYLVLSTIHSAKGLEFRVVQIIHASDGMIPSSRALNEENGAEEERRIFYVALTRAEDWLYISYLQRSYLGAASKTDGYHLVQPTRFIDESTPRLFEVRACSDTEDSELADAEAIEATDAMLRGLW